MLTVVMKAKTKRKKEKKKKIKEQVLIAFTYGKHPLLPVSPKSKVTFQPF